MHSESEKEIKLPKEEEMEKREKASKIQTYGILGHGLYAPDICKTRM